MYFGDTEVWRTSTAEPTANGIIFTYVKDMTEYVYPNAAVLLLPIIWILIIHQVYVLLEFTTDTNF
jgi:hypothetical protein